MNVRHLPLFVVIVLTIAGGGCATTTSTQPANGTALQDYVQGYRSYKSGDQSAALQKLESAVSKNPDLRMARTVLGDIYRQRSDYNAAARQYEVLTRLDPYTLSNNYYLGVCYQFLSRYVDAVKSYLAALNLEPRDFKTNMNLGTLYLSMGDVDNAVKHLDRATQIDPRSAAAWSNLGVALDTRESFVLAETAYRKAIELDSGSLAIMQNLANNLLRQEKVGEAIYLWEQVVARSQTPFTQTRLAQAYTRGSDFSKAAAQLDSILSADPRYVPAITAKADLQIRQYELSGFVDEARRQEGVKLLKQSLALNGNQPRVREQLTKYESALPLSK